jgi:hypothetical protein
LRKGHAAHWAVIHGIVISGSGSGIDDLQEEGDKKVKVIDPSKQSTSQYATKLFNESNSLLYVIAHHGKSLRPAVWKFNDLMKSNQNLYEISPKIIASSESYVLRDIKKDLCSKIVLLEKT